MESLRKLAVGNLPVHPKLSFREMVRVVGFDDRDEMFQLLLTVDANDFIVCSDYVWRLCFFDAVAEDLRLKMVRRMLSQRPRIKLFEFYDRSTGQYCFRLRCYDFLTLVFDIHTPRTLMARHMWMFVRMVATRYAQYELHVQTKQTAFFRAEASMLRAKIDELNERLNAQQSVAALVSYETDASVSDVKDISVAKLMKEIKRDSCRVEPLDEPPVKKARKRSSVSTNFRARKKKLVVSEIKMELVDEKNLCASSSPAAVAAAAVTTAVTNAVTNAAVTAAVTAATAVDDDDTERIEPKKIGRPRKKRAQKQRVLRRVFEPVVRMQTNKRTMMKIEELLKKIMVANKLASRVCWDSAAAKEDTNVRGVVVENATVTAKLEEHGQYNWNEDQVQFLHNFGLTWAHHIPDETKHDSTKPIRRSKRRRTSK